jgi:diguanylate cyclase (GGDEF)-like protein
VACRYGGDEFVVVMPETSKKNARIVAEKLRDAFKNNSFLKEENIFCTMTASFGVAAYPEDAKDKLELIHLADQAMYKVKNRSRDGVELA